jgi:predicted CoA-binding protein
LDGILIATHPDAAVDVVRQARERGVRHVWFHRSFGQGSVSDEAVRQCQAAGMNCIVGGCPLMYCAPVDLFHRGKSWWLRRSGRVPV